MAFRQPTNAVTVTSAYLTNCIYGDIIAKETIETNGTVNIVSGNTANMRAGSSIILQPGFSVALGGVFFADMQNITDCGN
jgi:hypothetical protein